MSKAIKVVTNNKTIEEIFREQDEQLFNSLMSSGQPPITGQTIPQSQPQRTVYQDLTGFKSNNTAWFENNPQKDNINLVNDPYRYANANKTFNDCVDSERYNRFVENVKQREGNYYHVSDQPTNAGIAQGAYNGIMELDGKKYTGYPNHVSKLTPEQIDNIYCQEYYKPSRGEAINNASIGEKVFDLFVNPGSGAAANMVQHAINDVTGWGIDTSGGIGTQTVTAFNNLTQEQSQAVFARIIELQKQYYKKNSADKWENGLNNRADKIKFYP